MSNKKEQKIIKDINQLEQLTLDNKMLNSKLVSVKESLASYFADKPLKIKHVRKATETGLGKPRKITEQLATFLGCETSDTKSRNDVTKAICKYIDEHKLQDSSNRKIIICDEKLIALLGLSKDNVKLSYTQIQLELNALFVEDSTEKKLNPTDKLVVFSKGKWTKDSLISWNDIKKYFTIYVQTHNLRVKRKITFNESLNELFGVSLTQEITQSQFDKYCKTLGVLVEQTDPAQYALIN